MENEKDTGIELMDSYLSNITPAKEENSDKKDVSTKHYVPIYPRANKYVHAEIMGDTVEFTVEGNKTCQYVISKRELRNLIMNIIGSKA